MATTTDQTSNPSLNQGASSDAPARVGVKPTSNPSTSRMGVSSQVNVGPIKQTGHKTLGGSNPGDHRPQSSDAVLPSNPPVRGEAEQAGS
jgi:hypothetical protein